MSPTDPTTELPADRGNRRLKQLDRALGIPALMLVGGAHRLRRRPAPPRSWKSIGLVKTAAIGDVVLLSGIVHDLRAARPDARIVLFVTSSNAGFARLLDDVDEIVELPVRAIGRAIARVRDEHVDVCIDFGSWPRFDALVTALSGAKWTEGRRTPGQHRHFGYDASIDHASSEHELENFRRLVRPLGIDSTSEPKLHAPPGPRLLEAPYAVLHLWPGGANFRERSWPEANWQALAHTLNDRGLSLVLTGGPGDAKATAGLIEAWRNAGIEAVSAAGASPADCARWLNGAVGVISVNTGVMHLAAALGTPTIGLNGPTSGRRWGPVGQHARCVASPEVPDGYLDLGFEQNEHFADCMTAITVPAVLRAWDEVTATGPTAATSVPTPGGASQDEAT